MGDITGMKGLSSPSLKPVLSFDTSSALIDFVSSLGGSPIFGENKNEASWEGLSVLCCHWVPGNPIFFSFAWWWLFLETGSDAVLGSLHFFGPLHSLLQVWTSGTWWGKPRLSLLDGKDSYCFVLTWTRKSSKTKTHGNRWGVRNSGGVSALGYRYLC